MTAQSIAEAQAPTGTATDQFTPAYWQRKREEAELLQTLQRNQVLLANPEAVATQARVDSAFMLAGKGHAPAPTAGQTGTEYARNAVAALKNCAGLSALDTTPMSDRSVSYLLDSVVEKVVGRPGTPVDPGIEPCWKRPYDVPAGQCRTVGIPDQSGREILTEVFGHGTPSPFRALYGAFMSQPQQAVAIGGKPISLNV